MEPRAVVSPAGIALHHGEVAALVGAGLRFQTTASIGARRWRSGPSQWAPGPANAEAPPDHGWWTATAPLGGDDHRFATDDPEGRVLVVRSQPLAGGVEVTVDVEGDRHGVEAVAAAWVAVPGERWFGFGERSDRVARTSGVVEHYVGEGPWQEWEYPFLGSTVPDWGLRQRLDATYYPVPWALSSRGPGVAVLDDGVSYARLRPGGAEVWSFEVEGPSLRLWLHHGPTPLDALAAYTAMVGRQAEPAPWWFGPWWQTGHDNHVPLAEEARQLAALRAAGAPVSVAETHCRYLPVGEHRGHEAGEAARVAQLHAGGVAVLAYLNPLVSVDFPEAFEPAAAAGALLADADGATYTFSAYAGGREPPVTLETQFDFTGPAGEAAWEGVADLLVDAGYDGWMEDFGEYTPLDAHLGGAPAGPAGHNRYPDDYHAAAARVTARLEARAGRRLARFVRSGWRATASVAPIVWGGDPTTSWGFDGLASAVVEGLSAGASGIAMWGSDIGGFVSSVERLTPELLCRWIEVGAHTPVMRTKAGGIQGPDVVRPQIWDDDVVAVWARWAAWHTQLQPYLAAAHADYRATGRPIMAAVGLVHPEADDADDAWLLGPDLFVAPVLADGARSRTVLLPPGRWVDLGAAAPWSADARTVRPGGPVVVHDGPGEVAVAAALDEVPTFVRAGAVVCLLDPGVDSLAPYPAPGVVGPGPQRRLLCWPDGPWSGPAGATARASSAVEPGGWRLRVEGGDDLRWQVEADLSLLGRPGAVEVAGAAAGWTYDPATGVVVAQMTGDLLTVRW